jgi:hypothetical protein
MNTILLIANLAKQDFGVVSAWRFDGAAAWAQVGGDLPALCLVSTFQSRRFPQLWWTLPFFAARARA